MATNTENNAQIPRLAKLFLRNGGHPVRLCILSDMFNYKYPGNPISSAWVDKNKTNHGTAPDLRNLIVDNFKTVKVGGAVYVIGLK